MSKNYTTVLIGVFWGITLLTAQKAPKNSLTGLTEKLSPLGIHIAPRATFFYQGFEPNADHLSNDAEFGGKIDALVRIDLEKLGLWKGISFKTHPELILGNTVNKMDGSFLAQNTALSYPGQHEGDKFDLTSAYIQQNFGKATFIQLGKINAIDFGGTNPFTGGIGLERFEHIALASVPSGLTHPSVLGSLFYKKSDNFRYILAVYEAKNIIDQTGFEKPFSEGTTFLADFAIDVTIAGKKGLHAFTGIYSNKDGTDFTTGQKTNSRFYIGYVFNQYLVQSKENPKKGWGIFGQTGFSDANPTIFDMSFLFGIGGTRLFRKRDNDNWGVAYYRYSLSNDFIEANQLYRGIVFENEEGLELFYDVALKPWFSIGTDLQFINSPIKENESSVFWGFRSLVKL